MATFPRVFIATALAVSLTLGAAGCSTSSAKGDDKVAATIDGDKIYESRVTAELDRVLVSNPKAYDGEEGAAARASDRLSIIDYLINQQLVAKAAKEEGIKVTDDEIATELAGLKESYGDDEAWQAGLKDVGYTEAQLKVEISNQLLQEKLAKKISADELASTPTDAEIQTFYENNQDYFVQAAGKRASHILFAADDKATAEKVLAELKAGGDFAAAAKKYSTDTANAESGGDLGWATGDEYVDAFKTAFLALGVGQMSDLVETEFGWHIILITDQREQSVTPLADVRDSIITEIRNAKANESFAAYMEELRSSCKIEVFDENGKRIDDGTGTAQSSSKESTATTSGQ